VSRAASSTTFSSGLVAAALVHFHLRFRDAASRHHSTWLHRNVAAGDTWAEHDTVEHAGGSLALVIDFGWTKEIEDRLLAPISIAGVAFEKILVGILQAMIAGLVVLPLAWLLMGVHLSLGLIDLLQLALVAVLSSWLFAAFGMVVATLVEPQQIGLVFNVLLAR